MSPAEQLGRGVDALGLALPPAQLEQLLAYLALLAKWNKVYNLTAVREENKMVSHHLLDSLAVLPHLRGGRLLDVGSGGGLPGIPLAIARGDMRVTLLDSHQKKTAFLKQVAIDLGLDNVEVVQHRVEEYRPAVLFDTVISRAFADLGEFASLSRHLLAPGGQFAAMKGIHPHEEIAQLPEGVTLRQVVPLTVQGLDAQRHLLLLDAAGATREQQSRPAHA
jgi:16S rRNA (guanine527-N7)-methyltransferase